MGWFSCYGSFKEDKKLKPLNRESKEGVSSAYQQVTQEKPKAKSYVEIRKEGSKEGSQQHIAAQTFTFRELAAATKNFRPECLLGEGGFGRVYKGRLESTGQVIAFFF